jgi:hypothetical protein
MTCAGMKPLRPRNPQPWRSPRWPSRISQPSAWTLR